MDQEVKNLSGGELQRVAITLCLGQAADIYLIDEPSAYLDSEQRIVAAKVRLPSLRVHHVNRHPWVSQAELRPAPQKASQQPCTPPRRG
jgi:ABC-type iron transport system FetAB ATPase subunit